MKALAAINAVWGDELEERGSDLRIEMGLRDGGGRPLGVTPSALAAEHGAPASRLVVLVHGLGQTEACWSRHGDDSPGGIWDRLREEPSTSPLAVRYNSGRHVSENGRQLAQLLEDAARSWPVPIEGIVLVGHSMGGLVIRSACHIGLTERHGWVGAVEKVVTLGTPHLGAPLEKTANLVSWGLRISAHSRPLAGFLNARSAGIKDLRFGAAIEDDWSGSDPDALLSDTVGDLLLPEGVDHHFVAAVITSNPKHPVGLLLGDLMVRVPSGTGRGARRHVGATEVRVVGGRRHFDLLDDPRVVDQVLAWATRPSGSTSARVGVLESHGPSHDLGHDG
jgi:pimeloyl-ACP methyl ester carboxylesterase